MAKPLDDDVKLEFSNLFRDDDPHRIILHRTWMRNILYYIGEQLFNVLDKKFIYKYLNKAYRPPINNFIREHVRSMKALTLNKSYVASVWPNSTEQIDKDAAELGEFVSQHFEIRRDYESDNIKEMVEIWRQITGNGFWRTFPDMDGGTYLIDKKGEIIGNTGDVRTECFLPFNVILPHFGQFLKEKICIGLKSLKEKEWVEDTFKIKLSTGEGQTAIIDYQKQLMTIIADVNPGLGDGLSQAVLDKKSEDLIEYKEIEWKPSKKYPNGRYSAMAGNDIVINDDKMPIETGKNGEWEYTLTHVPYNYTPGSFWATGSVDDLISPQNVTNDIDQTLATNRKSLGRPYVLTPVELAYKRISEAGSAILALQYDARMSGGAKPEVHRGTPYPTQVLEERAIHKQAAQEAAGNIKNVLSGQTPYAGAPGVLFDMLREAAEQSHTPDVKRFYRAYGKVKRKELMVAKNVYTENRFLKVIGPGNEVLVKKFKGANLHNNTDIRLELASGITNTNAGRANLVMQLLQYNFFNNPNISPDLQREILKMLGLSSFEQSTNLHKKRAEYENSVLMSDDIKALGRVALPGPIPKLDDNGKPILDPKTGEPEMIALFPETHDPIFRFDNHQLHIETLNKLIFSREFPTLSDEKQEYILGHLDMHIQSLQEQQREQEARMFAMAQIQKEGGQPMGQSTQGYNGPIPYEEK